MEILEEDICFLYEAKDFDNYEEELSKFKKYDFIDSEDISCASDKPRKLLNKLLYRPIVIRPIFNIKDKKICLTGSCVDKYDNISWYIVDEFNVYIMKFSTPHKPVYYFNEELTKKWRAIMIKSFDDYRDRLINHLNEEKDKDISNILSDIDDKIESL